MSKKTIDLTNVLEHCPEGTKLFLSLLGGMNMGQGNKELKAWVARDENGMLYLYTAKPKKIRDNWFAEKVGYAKINDSLFPEVQWSDEEPKGIVLSIKNGKSKIKSALSFVCRFSLFVFFLSFTVVGILHVIQWIIRQTFLT